MSDHARGGNASFRFADTAILSVSIAEAPIVVTSAEIDEALSDTYARLDVRPGLLEGLAGIVERRWWPEDVTFADAAAMAGVKALAEAGVDAERVGLLIDTSVSRAHLEPSAAVDVHHQLGMPSHCLNFDLSNACLGFVNGMHLAGTSLAGIEANRAGHGDLDPAAQCRRDLRRAAPPPECPPAPPTPAARLPAGRPHGP